MLLPFHPFPGPQRSWRCPSACSRSRIAFASLSLLPSPPFVPFSPALRLLLHGQSVCGSSSHSNLRNSRLASQSRAVSSSRNQLRSAMRSALLLLGLLARCAAGYQVLVTDQDEVRLFPLPTSRCIARTDCRSPTRSGRSAAGCGARERRIRSSRVRTAPPLLREPSSEPYNVRFPPAVLFSPSSRGQAALVVYEWQDAKYLGVGADGQQGDNDWSEDVRTFFAPELSPRN